MGEASTTLAVANLGAAVVVEVAMTVNKVEEAVAAGKFSSSGSLTWPDSAFNGNMRTTVALMVTLDEWRWKGMMCEDTPATDEDTHYAKHHELDMAQQHSWNFLLISAIL